MAIVACGFSSMIQWPDPGMNPLPHIGRRGAHHGRHRRAERLLALRPPAPASPGGPLSQATRDCRRHPGRRPRIARNPNASRRGGHKGPGRSQCVRVASSKLAGSAEDFVPEFGQDNLLAACDQPLHVRAAEAKMPKKRVFQIFVPGADAWNRRIDQHENRRTCSGCCAANWKATILPMSCATRSI